MIYSGVLPKGTNTVPLKEAKKISCMAGVMTTQEMVQLRDIRLPEFDKNRRVAEQKALVFHKKLRYDLILGADFLTKVGINIIYENGTMTWLGNTLPMREP